MFKLRSISARLILAISLTVAAACGILGTFSIMQQRSLMRLALEQQLKLQYDSVIAAIDYEGRATLAVSAVVAALPPVADAIAKGDRDALAALLGGADEGVDGARHPADHLPDAAGDWSSTASTRPKVFGDDISARRNTVVEANKTGKPIVGVEPGREALSIFGMTPIMRDGKSHGECRRRRRLRQGIRRPRQEALRHRPRRAIVRRQGIQEAVLDLRRHRGRHAGRTEERVRRRGRCIATPPSTAIRPRSMSGRSGTTPASRSRCSRSSRTPPNTRRRRRVRSAL